MGEQQKTREWPLGLTATNQPAPRANEAEMEIDLVDLLFRLLGYWKQIVAAALAGALIAAIVTIRFMTPLYRATSTIYVLSRKDSAINLTDLNLGSALTSDYIKVFSMWEVHEQVITGLDLPYSYNKIRSMLSVTNPTGTRMLDITVTSPDPEEAAQVSNKYAEVASTYIADTMATDKPSIMSVALVPTNPVSPNRTRNIMLGFLLGGILAAGIVTVLYLLDDRYKTSDDIRKYTGLTTLAVVPLEENMKKDHRGTSRRKKA